MSSQPQQGMVKISELQVNPEYETLLPLLLDEDLKNLEKSILKDGILHPLIINPDKVVLDGHHRLLICKRHSINEVPFVERFFESDFDEEEFVISFNLNRRHLSTTQKVELGLTILKIEMKKARWRYLATLPKKGNKGFINVHPKSDGHCEERGQAIEKAAKKVGLALTISKIEMEKARRRQLSQLKQFREENTVPSELKERDEEKEFVISFNLNRRHLTMIQKVELGITFIKSKWKRGGRGKKQLS